MKKTYQKIISLLTVSLLSVPPAAVSAYTTELEIEQRGNEAFITAYTGEETNIPLQPSTSVRSPTDPLKALCCLKI